MSSCLLVCFVFCCVKESSCSQQLFMHFLGSKFSQIGHLREEPVCLSRTTRFQWFSANSPAGGAADKTHENIVSRDVLKTTCPALTLCSIGGFTVLKIITHLPRRHNNCSQTKGIQRFSLNHVLFPLPRLPVCLSDIKTCFCDQLGSHGRSGVNTLETF